MNDSYDRYEEYKKFSNIINGIKSSLYQMDDILGKNIEYSRARVKVWDTIKDDLMEFEKLKGSIVSILDSLDKLVKIKSSGILYLIGEGKQKENKNAEKIASILQKVNQISKKVMPELIEQLHDSIIKANHISIRLRNILSRELKSEVSKGEISEARYDKFRDEYRESTEGIDNVLDMGNWEIIKRAERIEYINPEMDQQKEQNTDVHLNLSDDYDAKKAKIAELEKAVEDLDATLSLADDYTKEEQKEQISKNLETVKRKFKPKEITVTLEGLQKLRNSALLEEDLRYIKQVLNDNPMAYAKSSGKKVEKINNLLIQVELLLDEAISKASVQSANLSQEHELSAEGYAGMAYAADALNANRVVIDENDKIKQAGIYSEAAIEEFEKELHDRLERAKMEGATPQELAEIEAKMRNNFRLFGSYSIYEDAAAYRRGENHEISQKYQDVKSTLEDSSALKEAIGEIKTYSDVIDEAHKGRGF